MNSVSYSKEIPLYGEYDICVLGGGPAGVCAAVSAARQSRRVLLVEATGVLGGMATSGMVGPFMTCYDREGESRCVGGLFDEIVARLQTRSAVIAPENTDSPSVYTSFIEKYHRHVTPFLSFELEIVLDELVRQSGAELLCYTQFADCIVEEGRIRHCLLNAPQGLICVSADMFIDCTGNAAVAEKAGVPTYKGEEQSGIPQPGTLMFEVGGVDDDAYSARPERPVKAYRTPEAGRYRVNHYHVYNVDAADARSLTDAHSEARLQVLDALRVLREKTPGFEKAQFLGAAPVLGIRESRHIEGEYRITVQDVAEGTKFHDRIAVYGFGMDVHNRCETESGNFRTEVAKRYYIPYRSLIPKGCHNLLVAGKTISCESQAVGGMRCMPAAMAMGQAAGIAAVLALSCNADPRRIDIFRLQAGLTDAGAIID